VVRSLLELGATEVLVVCDGGSAGEARAAGASAVEADPLGAGGWDGLLADPPAAVLAAVAAADPHASARVLLPPGCPAAGLGGRPAFGALRTPAQALRDPVAALRLWREAGLPVAPAAVVEAAADAPPAAAELDRGSGTVWASARWRGSRWVPDFAEPPAELAAGCTPHTGGGAAGDGGSAGRTAVGGLVRVMPFLAGRPCGVHGVVLGDGVAALRPVEHVTVRGDAGSRLRRIGHGTVWDPPAWAREELGDAAARVGAVLAARGLRGGFEVHGVLTADGFRPTGCTPWWEDTADYLDIALPELPYRLLHHALAAGEPAGVPAAELASLLVDAADNHRHAVVRLPAASWPAGTAALELRRAPGSGWTAAAVAPPAAAPERHGEPVVCLQIPPSPRGVAAREPGDPAAAAALVAVAGERGWTLEVTLDPAGLRPGSAIAGQAVEIAGWLDRAHNTGIGRLVAGEDPPDRPAVRRSLALSAPLRRMPHRVLRELLDLLPPDTPPDGPQGPVARLERRVVALLGKPAALFFPTGTMAQQVALRIHAERTGRHAFAGHPQTHLDVWEGRGYGVLHDLRFHPVGDRNELMGAAEVAAVGEPLAAVVWELPQRDLGGQLPSWPALRDQIRTARDRGAATHLDGARLWEAQTFYRRPFTELAALFDTVYVSLYKSLEGVRGAVLAADAATVAEAQVWRRRLGGGMPDAWPLAAAGLLGLDRLLPRMAAFRDHAIAIAAAINTDGTARTVPDPPQTPLFHVHLPVARRGAELAAAGLLAEHGVQLFRALRSAPDPSRCAFEITIGENAMDFSPQEVVGHIRDLVHRARAVARP
jgi:threonine aldolase